jgi:hypothetical protein
VKALLAGAVFTAALSGAEPADAIEESDSRFDAWS